MLFNQQFSKDLLILGQFLYQIFYSVYISIAQGHYTHCQCDNTVKTSTGGEKKATGKHRSKPPCLTWHLIDAEVDTDCRLNTCCKYRKRRRETCINCIRNYAAS